MYDLARNLNYFNIHKICYIHKLDYVRIMIVNLTILNNKSKKITKNVRERALSYLIRAVFEHLFNINT